MFFGERLIVDLFVVKLNINDLFLIISMIYEMIDNGYTESKYLYSG